MYQKCDTYVLCWCIVWSQLFKVIKAIRERVEGLENTVLSPDLVIEKFAQKLSLEPAVCQRAVNTAKKAKELDGMSSLLPQTLAGAVLLLAVKVSRSPSSRDSTGGEELPHADITADSMAELSEVSSATLKRVHKRLFASRSGLLPQEYISDLCARGLEPMPTSEL